MSYFNTTRLEGEQLRNEITNAEYQEDKVMAIFKHHRVNIKPFKGLSPSDVHIHLTEYPITSIRRAMTNLTNRGSLFKTGTQKEGPYGKPEYLWI